MARSNYIVLALLLVVAVGCRARKLSVSKSDSSKTTTQSSVLKKESKEVDTGKVVVKSTTDKKEVVLINDSTKTKTVITPVPGKSVTVLGDGTFVGEASSVVTEQQGRKQKETRTDSHKVDSTSSQKGITKDIFIDSSGSKTEDIKVSTYNKNLDAKPSYGVWPWAIFTGLLVLLIFVLWWYFGKPVNKK